MKNIACLLLFFSTACCLHAEKKYTVSSPDKNIVFSIGVYGGLPAYSIVYNKQPIISNSPISFLLKGQQPWSHVVLGTPTYHDTIDQYHLIVGKAKDVSIAYHEMRLPITVSGSAQRLAIVVRVFNDGIGFRYEYLSTGTDSLFISDEQTSFNFASEPILHGLLLPNFTTSHEGHYSKLHLHDLPQDTLVDMPALFELPNNVFVGITEAALLDYAGMYLQRRNGMLMSRLSPWPGSNDICVRASPQHKSPWRVLLISNRIGALVESNIITTLNENCSFNDTAWIKPGTTTFPWWNGNVLPDTINAPGNNFVTAKYYIDFCARNHIPYHSVVEYGLHQWYMDDGIGFQPGPHSDVTTPVPGLDMAEICRYGKSVGVGIRVWVHWAALYPKLDSAFSIFEKWGLQGMMVDFMDRDDQQMVNIQTEILQKAFQHHLHIQFHGAYKPTGLHRTFPNEFTREGTLNYEVDKWGTSVNPDHDIMMPFTRMLAGSTDYHLGGFRAVPDSAFVIQYTRPLVMGSRAHMLAMYVVLENYLGMVCDYPAAYEGQPGFDFLKDVPTTWDETKVLDAKIGEYIIIARRKNNNWWIGGITNNTKRKINLQCSFLPGANYHATVYADASDADLNRNHLNITMPNIKPSDHIEIDMTPGGGFAMRINKLD